MLSEDQRRAIEEEEELRHEVRKRLEAANPPPPPAPPPPPPHHGFGKRLFDFFNSSVGMWLLSSVVLTGGAAALQSVQHSHEMELKNREQLAQHKFEITHRLDQMEYTLRRAKTVGEAKAAMDGMFKSRFPLTPELQNRSLGSLFLTVHQLAAGTDQQKTEQAMNFIRRLEDAELGLQNQTKDDAPLDEKQKQHLHKLLKSIKALHHPATPEGKPEAAS
jgi:hypothetical protein